VTPDRRLEGRETGEIELGTERLEGATRRL
jgi:hypothetical protein